jgi:integrase
MPVYFDARKKRWRFTFNRIVSGRRHRASRLLPAAWDRRRAEAYDRQETGRLYAVATGLERAPRLIDDAVRLYLDERIPKLRSGEWASRHLAAVLQWYEGRDLSELPDVARRYAADNATTLRPGTIRSRLAWLKAACRYAWKQHGITEHDPTGRMTVPAADDDRHVYIKLADLKRLLKKFDDPEAAALTRIAFYTGLRWISELLPRTRADIKRNGDETWLNVGTTKNGTPRMVPIHAAIEPDLKRIPFTRPARHYYAAFQRARKKAGLDHLRMHDLRHSLASEIISTGGTLADVQGALHHKSVASSRRYAHLYPERLRHIMLKVGRK